MLSKIFFNENVSIKSQLIYWFCGLALLPAILLTAVTIIFTTDQLQRVVAHDLKGSARDHATLLQQWFESRKREVEYQASLPENIALMSALSEGLGESKKEIAHFAISDEWREIVEKHVTPLKAYYGAYDNVHDVFLIDTQGNILYTVEFEVDFGSNLIDGLYASSRFGEAVRASLKSNKTVFSDIERYSPSGGMLSIFVISPINNESGELLGLLAVQFQTEAFNNLLREPIRGLKHYIISDDGTLRTPPTEERKNEVLLRQVKVPSLTAHLDAQPASHWSLLNHYINHDGEHVIGVMQPVPVVDSSWYLVSEFSDRFAYQHIFQLAGFNVIVLLVVAAFSVALAVFIARKIGEPLVLLNRAIQAVRYGDYQVVTSLKGNKEILELSQSFNLMVSARRHYERELEKRNDEVKRVLAELEEQHKALAHHAIVAITDLKGTITFVNQKFCEISEYSEDELLGKNHRILNSSCHDKNFFREMYLAISKGQVWQGEICNRARGGRLYWVATTIVPMRDAAGKIRAYIAVRTDITAQKYMLEELSRANVHALEASKAKSEFLACMSHEIRTPMNAIMGMLTLLRQSPLASDQLRKLEIADDSAKSLLAIIDDILDFSKIDAGKLTIESVEFNLVAMFANVAAALNIKAEGKQLDFVLDTRELVHATVKGDPTRLRQILNNLLSNAVKFTDHGHVILKVRTCENDGVVELFCEVHDSGVGIDKSHIPHLFEAFSQADSTTTRRFGGTGLGLTIVRRLCQLMGGDVSVSSDLGYGSVFCFNVLLGHIPAQPAQYDFKNKRFLIIEPSVEAGEVWYDALTDCGASTVVVPTSAEAINILDTVYSIARPSTGEGSNLPPGFDAMVVSITEANSVSELMLSIESLAHVPALAILFLASATHSHLAEAHIKQIRIAGVMPKPTPTQNLLRKMNDLLTEPVAKLAPIDNEPQSLDKAKRAQAIAGARVLLVEDNAINQMVARELLEDFGISVELADDGKQALAWLKHSAATVDVVLMDCQMPVMDGFEATRLIRQGDAGELAASMPIIAMTANAMAGDKERCIAAGMSDYLSKPINVELLERALVQWLPAKNDRQSHQTPTAEEVAVIPEINAEVWDYQGALKRVRGKQARLIKLAQLFQEGSADTLQQLSTFAVEDDADAFERGCHTLKGVAANMGGDRLMSLAAELEVQVREGNFDQAKARLPQLNAVTQQLLDLLAQFTSNPEAYDQSA